MYKSIVIFFFALCFLALGGVLVRFSGLEPVASAFYRCLFALPFLFIWSKFSKHNKQEYMIKKDIIFIVISGFFLAIDLILWHHSFFLTTIANANLLANLVPFILVPLCFIFFKDTVGKLFVLAVILTIIGLFLLAYGKTEFNKENLTGDIFALLTAFFYALYLFVMMKFREKYHPSYLMFFSTMGCCVFLLFFSIVMHVDLSINSIKSLFILLLLAITSQILGQGSMTVVLGNLPHIFSSTLILLQPVIAAIYGFVLFNERLSILEILGITTILVGVWVSKKSAYKGEKT